MSKVSLIFPRSTYAAGDFSLGLAYIAAYLKRALSDIELDLIDTTFNPGADYVTAQLSQRPPDVVGIYMDTLMYGDALQAAQAAHAGGALVVMGGPHPTILPETVISHEHVDVVCIGEGEETFRDIVQATAGQNRLEDIAGIWYKRDGQVVRNPCRPPVQDLDTLPFPDVAMFDVERYIRNFIQFDSYNPKLRGMSMIVSRGCPFRCAYCQPTLTTMFGRKFRIRSPGHVIRELILLKERYRIDAVYFQDDTLTVSRNWIMELCHLMNAEKLDIVWACNTRADVVDEDMLQAMKQAGLVKLKVGIESVSDRIRNGIYGKNISMTQIEQLLRWARRLEIQVAGFFMLGAPTESAREIRDTIRFAASSDLQEANFSVTVALPATYLYEQAQTHSWLLPQSYGGYDYYHALRPAFTDTDLSARKLELYKKFAYLSFYLAPKRLRQTLKLICSVRKTLQKLRRF